jgi:DNA-binding NarL/FixJ family response regulator
VLGYDAPDALGVPTDAAGQADRASANPIGDGDLCSGTLDGTAGAAAAMSAVTEAGKVRVALIDSLRFSRDCLIRAVGSYHSELALVPFASVVDCIRFAPDGFELILYHSHEDGPFEPVVFQQIRSLRQSFPDVPIVMLSDATTALRPRNIRDVLSNGAQGFIPTLTTEIPAALAAIRFVKDGGTFAPLDVLLPSRKEQTGTPPDVPLTPHLTMRQTTVLSHLRQGKSNKIIAHDLGMTESTVKVHVRNIMRKMGATNRTQAVYNAKQLWNRFDDLESSE